MMLRSCNFFHLNTLYVSGYTNGLKVILYLKDIITDKNIISKYIDSSHISSHMSIVGINNIKYWAHDNIIPHESYYNPPPDKVYISNGPK